MSVKQSSIGNLRQRHVIKRCNSNWRTRWTVHGALKATATKSFRPLRKRSRTLVASTVCRQQQLQSSASSQSIQTAAGQEAYKKSAPAPLAESEFGPCSAWQATTTGYYQLPSYSEAVSISISQHTGGRMLLTAESAYPCNSACIKRILGRV